MNIYIKNTQKGCVLIISSKYALKNKTTVQMILTLAWQAELQFLGATREIMSDFFDAGLKHLLWHSFQRFFCVSFKKIEKISY